MSDESTESTESTEQPQSGGGFFSRRLIWQGRPWEAFQTIAIIFSLIVNAVLLLIVFFLGIYLFQIKEVIAGPLVGGLYEGFVAMDGATIRRTIPVQDNIPVNFDLPISQPTTVILTADVPLNDMELLVNLGNGNTLRGTASIVLPAGSQLPIQLDMTVPVASNIPIDIQVEAVIPLNETELHPPFDNFATLFAPYNQMLVDTPDSWGELFAKLLGRE